MLNAKQKQVFLKNFKELAGPKIDGFDQMLENQWELLFYDTDPQLESGKFKKFVQAVQDKPNTIHLMSCQINGARTIFGGFSRKNIPLLGDSWAHEFDYQIPFDESNFVLYYTEEKELHFTMLHNKPFGYIYTDYENGGALSISGDFFLISWSYEFQHSCGNIYDMKCIEDPSIMAFYNNMQMERYEVWMPKPGTKATVEDGKAKSEFKQNPHYLEFSPFNFFRENIVFEVPKKMKLAQVAKELLSSTPRFLKGGAHLEA